MNTEWKLVPVEPTPEMWAAVNKLDDEMAAGGYDGKGASIEQVWNCLVAAAPTSHPIPTGATGERDWELACDNCNGSGHVFVKHQVAERKTDVQEFKEECECCEGRGFNIAFEDIPGIAEYVKSCRAAPAAGDALPSFDIEAAAQKMAECMDYPWAHMPQQGRTHMRKYAQAVIDAAIAQQSQRKEA